LSVLKKTISIKRENHDFIVEIALRLTELYNRPINYSEALNYIIEHSRYSIEVALARLKKAGIPHV